MVTCLYPPDLQAFQQPAPNMEKDLTQPPLLCSHFHHDVLKPAHQNRHTHNKTKKQWQGWQSYTWAKCQDWLRGRGTGSGGMPCSQPLAKTKVRATINSVLLADCSFKFFPRTFGGGAFNWGQKGDLQTPDVYWYMEPAEVTRWMGRTLTTSPTLASGSPLALLSVAKLVIYTVSVHLKQACFLSHSFCVSQEFRDGLRVCFWFRVSHNVKMSGWAVVIWRFDWG